MTLPIVDPHGALFTAETPLTPEKRELFMEYAGEAGRGKIPLLTPSLSDAEGPGSLANPPAPGA